MVLEQENKIQIEVVYADVEDIHCIPLELNIGASIGEAIKASGILERCPEINLNKNKVGVFSKLRELDELVSSNDRVEIYRPLKVDPKESRRRRAAIKQQADKNK